MEAARKRHQEELELVKQEAGEQAKRQAERLAKKKLDEEKRKIEAEAQVCFDFVVLFLVCSPVNLVLLLSLQY